MEISSLVDNSYMNNDQTCIFEPPDVYLDDNIMDIKFSPVANVLAVAQVTGEIRIYSYNDKETTEQMKFDYHTDSCRAIEFSPDG